MHRAPPCSSSFSKTSGLWLKSKQRAQASREFLSQLQEVMTPEAEALAMSPHAASFASEAHLEHRLCPYPLFLGSKFKM